MNFRKGEQFAFTHLISVRLWNFKDGGSLKAEFWVNNQHT